MQSADPIGESTDGQVGAQTSNRLSVLRSRTRLSFVKMKRSTIRPIPVSAVWKAPDDLAQTRVRRPKPSRDKLERARKAPNPLRGDGRDRAPANRPIIPIFDRRLGSAGGAFGQNRGAEPSLRSPTQHIHIT